MIAALYVLPDGPYANLKGVDPWPKGRDARLYEGPHPVVAHPPCERWGRYWSGGPSARVRKNMGDDDGCFAAALSAVRRFGGVLEHPEGSAAWPWFGLVRPPKTGGWYAADILGGWTCCVEQGHYGHAARKATWLYAFGIPGSRLPDLAWGVAEKKHPRAAELGVGYASRGRRPTRTGICQQLSKRQRTITPQPFARLLVSLAGLAKGGA